MVMGLAVETPNTSTMLFLSRVATQETACLGLVVSITRDANKRPDFAIVRLSERNVNTKGL